MSTFYIKQNDTTPAIRATLENGSGDAVDLASTTVRFHMRALGGTTVKVDAAATVINANTGIVQYDWDAADTDTVGTFQGEFEVTYSDGSIETFPNNGYIPIVITDDIT